MDNIVTKGWGYELWIENNELYCGKHLHVLPGKFCSIHYHKKKKETFYVIGGELLLEYSKKISDVEIDENMILPGGYIWYDVNKIILKKGDCFTLEVNTPHRFTSNTSYPCDFIEFSTHHDDNDSYRLIKGD